MPCVVPAALCGSHTASCALLSAFTGNSPAGLLAPGCVREGKRSGVAGSESRMPLAGLVCHGGPRSAVCVLHASGHSAPCRCGPAGGICTWHKGRRPGRLRVPLVVCPYGQFKYITFWSGHVGTFSRADLGGVSGTPADGPDLGFPSFVLSCYTRKTHYNNVTHTQVARGPQTPFREVFYTRNAFFSLLTYFFVVL